MKRINTIAVIISMLVLILAGCSEEAVSTDSLSEEISTGSLCVRVGSQVSRTIRPESDSIKVSSHRIVGSYNGTITVDKTFTEDTITLGSLRSGEWKFYVSGLNSSNEEIARSETKTVDIIQNETSSLSFSLSYFSDGRGMMDLSIKIPSADTTVYKVIAEFTPINNAELQNKTITALKENTTVDGESTVFSFSGAIETGRYRVKFTMYDSLGNQIGYALNEVLHIYRDMTSLYSWYWDKDYIPPVAEPVFSIESGLFMDGEQLELSTTEEDATIYYTTDGETPSSASNKYTGPITLDKSMTIKAIAIKEGLVDSAVTEETYTVKVKAPTIALKSGSFKTDQSTTLSSATADSRLYYTLDGTDPSAESTLYESAISLTRNSKLRVIAVKDGLESSEIVGEDYTFLCITPSINYESGVYGNDFSARLSTTTAGADVYYTLDGTVPTTVSTKYVEDSPISVDKTMTVRAATFKDGWNTSDEVKREYTMKCLTPSFSITAGSYDETQSVVLSSTTGATIYYTTDGTVPVTSSYVYVSAITVDKDTTIKAFAVKSGYTDSDTATADYYIAPQTTGVTVLDPITSDFRMGMPEGWSTGMNILQTIEEATLFVDTTSNVKNIQWFYDGYEKDDFKNRSSITVGNSEKDIPLELGGHVITLRVLINGVSYTENLYYNCVSAEVSDNFVFWGDLELGGEGPGGGYLIYDVDADNDSGNADGLKSRECGWKYIEVAPNDMRLLDGVPDVAATESSTSTFIYGYYRNAESVLSYANGSTPSSKLFNTGYDNTASLVSAMQDSGYTTESGSTVASYAAKLCKDMSSHIKEGAIKGWFLPSVDEMKFVISNMPENLQSTFTHDKYWTSTEAETGPGFAYYIVYSTNTETVGYRRDSYAARPIRRF